MTTCFDLHVLGQTCKSHRDEVEPGHREHKEPRGVRACVCQCGRPTDPSLYGSELKPSFHTRGALEQVGPRACRCCASFKARRQEPVNRSRRQESVKRSSTTRHVASDVKNRSRSATNSTSFHVVRKMSQSCDFTDTCSARSVGHD